MSNNFVSILYKEHPTQKELLFVLEQLEIKPQKFEKYYNKIAPWLLSLESVDDELVERYCHIGEWVSNICGQLEKTEL